MRDFDSGENLYPSTGLSICGKTNFIGFSVAIPTFRRHIIGSRKRMFSRHTYQHETSSTDLLRDTIMKLSRLLSFMAVAVLAFSSSQLFAQSYADVSSESLDYVDIFESTGGGLFGQPTASGMELNFPTTGFNAEGVDGAVDFLNGIVELTASSNTGQTFSQVTLDEFGVYFNTGDSESSVEAFLTVVTADGLFTDSFHLEFGEGSGTWIGGVTVSFPATLEADIFVHNILLADSVPDEVAAINKRDVNLTVGVPEPSMAGILLFGLCGIAARRRR